MEPKQITDICYADDVILNERDDETLDRNIEIYRSEFVRIDKRINTWKTKLRTSNYNSGQFKVFWNNDYTRRNTDKEVQERLSSMERLFMAKM